MPTKTNEPKIRSSSSWFSVCCGEGEEESKYGSFVDPNEYQERWDSRESNFVASARQHIRYIEEKIGIVGSAKRSFVYADDNEGASSCAPCDENDTQGGSDQHYTCLRGTVVSKPLDLTENFVPPVYDKTEEQMEFLDRSLDKNFIFMDLCPKERQAFVLALQHHGCTTRGEVIIRKGDVGDYFYIVENGTVNFVDAVVSNDNNANTDGNMKHAVVGSCSRGDSFGELALLYDSPRAVSCVAASDRVCLWKIDQNTFRHILARSSEEKQSSKKTWIKSIDTFKGLSDQCLTRFAEALIVVHWKAGERIVQKGEAGNVFYIIQEGKVRVHDIGLGDGHVRENELGPGSFFGEGSLLTGQPRAASVTAITDVTTLALDRETFEFALGPLRELLDWGLRKKYIVVLPLFSCGSLTDPEIDQLVPLMKEVCYRKGEFLAEPGKPYQMNLWFVREGSILVYSNKDPGKIYKLQNGDYFGDKSIRGDPSHISSHTAICEENLTALVLSREDIESVIGDITRLGQPFNYTKQKVINPIHFDELKKHRVLGTGAFGKVWLVTNNKEEADEDSNKTPYALKAISKRKLIESGQAQSVKREKDLLCLLEHQFIMPLVASYQDEKYVYLLSHVIPGGELYEQLQTRRSRDAGLPPKDAAFYSACIVEALGHFHQRSIAYRDLKLENVLVDKDGYLVIVDLGFAKIVADKTYTLVGTPEYLAPEIIMSKGHDKAVDYWSYGILCYELLVGHSPFYTPGTSQMDMFKRIVLLRYDMPKRCISDDAADLIKSLLVRRPSNRLGNLANGYLDIKAHEWFRKENVDFRKVIKKEMQAPFKPELKNLFRKPGRKDFAEENYGPRLTKEEEDMFSDF